MQPIGLVWGTKLIHNQMKAISILCAVSYAILLITMCDMGVWFWIASAAFAVTSLVISNELDNIENQKNKAMTTVEELQSMTHEDLCKTCTRTGTRP